MIELINVTQHYSVRPVLKQISLQVKRGELVVVVGPNGMGKSTLLGVMAGTLTPQNGTVTIAGRRRRGTLGLDPAGRSGGGGTPSRDCLPGV